LAACTRANPIQDIAVLTYTVYTRRTPRYPGRSPRYCWCPWSTGAAFCRNQSAGCACLHAPSVAELFRLPPLSSGTVYRNTSS